MKFAVEVLMGKVVCESGCELRRAAQKVARRDHTPKRHFKFGTKILQGKISSVVDRLRKIWCLHSAARAAAALALASERE